MLGRGEKVRKGEKHPPTYPLHPIHPEPSVLAKSEVDATSVSVFLWLIMVWPFLAASLAGVLLVMLALGAVTELPVFSLKGVLVGAGLSLILGALAARWFSDSLGGASVREGASESSVESASVAWVVLAAIFCAAGVALFALTPWMERAHCTWAIELRSGRTAASYSGVEGCRQLADLIRSDSPFKRSVTKEDVALLAMAEVEEWSDDRKRALQRRLVDSPEADEIDEKGNQLQSRLWVARGLASLSFLVGLALFWRWSAARRRGRAAS